MEGNKLQHFLKELEGKKIEIKECRNDGNHYDCIDKMVIDIDGKEYILKACGHDNNGIFDVLEVLEDNVN